MPRARLVCLVALFACDAPAVVVDDEDIVPDNEVCTPVAEWDDEHAALEAEFQDALNALRADGGTCGDLVFPPAPPVYMDPSLRCAARLHSQDMAERTYLGEVDPDSIGTAVRLAQVGYTAVTFAENVGFGYPTVASALALWADSPVNCWKLRARELTDIGVGVHTGAYAPKDEDPITGLYWTVTFAAP